MFKSFTITFLFILLSCISGFTQHQDTIDQLNNSYLKIGTISKPPSNQQQSTYSGVFNSLINIGSNISSEELKESQKTDATRIMQSRISGLSVSANSYSPGASSRITMRGFRSFTGNNQPLILLNGMPIDNAEWNNTTRQTDQSNRLLDIDPNIIESIELIKSGAGRAKYGIVGGNGVIHITTKKGYESKPKITFTTSIGIDQISELPILQNSFGQGRTIDGQPLYRGPETRESFSWGPNISNLFFDRDPNYPFDENGALFFATSNNGLPANIYNPYDLFENGLNSNLSLNLTGGGEKVNYLITASSNNQNGVIPTTNYNRNNISAILNYKINQKFSLQLNTLISKSIARRNQTGSNFNGIMLGLLRTPVTFDNSNGLEDPLNNPIAYELSDGSQRSFRSGIYDNPYWSLNKNKHEDDVFRRIIQVSGKHELSKKLVLLFNLGSDNYQDKRVGGIDINPNISSGMAYDRKINYDAKAVDFSLSYQIKKTKDFEINSTIGLNYNIDETFYDLTEGIGLRSSNNVTIENLEEVESIKLSNQVKRTGTILNFDASFKDMINMTGSLKQDYSNKFGNKTNGFLSYGLGAGISILNLINNSNQQSAEKPMSLELIGSYGRFGNEPRIIGNTPRYLNAFIAGDGFFGAEEINQLEVNNSFVSESLRAESLTVFDIGLDFRMMKNNLHFNITYYNESSKDLILTERLAASTGFLFEQGNKGSMTNKGIDISFSIKPINKEKFNWKFSADFNKNVNTVINTGASNNFIELGVLGQVSSVASLNSPFGIIKGSGFQRNEEGILIIGEDGFPLIDRDDILLADPNPDWTMYLNNSFQLGKKLTLSATLDIKQGGKMYCGTCGTLDYFGRTKRSLDDRNTTQIFEGVTEDGLVNSTSVELAPANGTYTDYYRTRYGFGGLTEMSIYDASWIRLRNLSIKYDFSDLIKLKAIKNLSLRFFAENLLVISDYPGIDPETNLTGNSGGIGLEYYNNPGTRRYGVTFQASF